MPENCNNCEYTKCCQSHYGGLGCKKWKEYMDKKQEPVGSFLVEERNSNDCN